MERPSYLLTVPASEYHQATKENKYTTSHRLNLFRKCPALYKKTIDGEIVEGDTAAFEFGRATHVLILEGKEKFDAEYMVSDGPTNEKTGKPYSKVTKAFTEWAAKQTKPVVTTADYEMIDKMREAVHAHKAAADLLSSGIAEATVRTEWNGEPVQSRLDWFDPERGVLVDLKTCADIDKLGFDIRDFGYVHQMAFYGSVLRRAGYQGPLRICLVAVEKKEPYRVSVCEFFPVTLNDANDSDPGTKWGPGNDQMIAELQNCRLSGVWPTRYEEIIRM